MDANELWAKSCHQGDEPRESMKLQQHLNDAVVAATRVLDATGAQQLGALGLSAEYEDRLRRCVLLAAAVHDLGKANDHFQRMIRQPRGEMPQGIRHEWVTLLMLQTLRPWLLQAAGSEADFAVVEWAVAGHHPAHHHASPPMSGTAGAGPEITFYTDWSDFHAIVDWLGTTFPTAGSLPPWPPAKRNLVGGANVFAEIGKWSRESMQRWERFSADDRLFAASVKASLIAADVAASALPEKPVNGEIAWDWITQSFGERPTQRDLDEIVRMRLDGRVPREFQNQVAASTVPVTFVKAGCGTGKTLAAYMWAARNHAGRRLYFCYPTTGTATEGYKDYLHEVDVKADLFHSRRAVDFEIILGTGGDERGDDTQLRVASLDAWATPIVACTVDTVLGLVQNNRKSLYGWPALAQSAFVFDEIHAYDDRLFGALLRFLRDLPGLPVLLMTASLPTPREEALRRTLALRPERFRVELCPIEGPRDLEELPRYHKAAVANNDPLPLIEKELKAGGKVLWVCNTVKRVMDAADRAAHLAPKVYHSRFKYEHRVERHRDVVGAFTLEHEEAALAICSQVAEMSLDLKGCTLLVTDVAPVPALIQRLGRLARHIKAGDLTRPFVVVEPGGDLPYSAEELEAARAWHARLPEEAISQSTLARCWEQAGDEANCPLASAWLDGGPETKVVELREGSPGITVLMEDDLAAVKAKPKSLARYTLSMPPHGDWQNWRRHRGIPIAPRGSIRYDKLRGAEWKINA